MEEGPELAENIIMLSDQVLWDINNCLKLSSELSCIFTNLLTSEV